MLQRTQRKLSLGEEEQARVLFENSGLSLNKLAQRFGVSRATMTKYARTGGWVNPVDAVRNAPTTAIARAVEERAQREALGLNSDDPLGALEAVVDERAQLMRSHGQDWRMMAGLREQIYLALNEPSWRPPQSWNIPGAASDKYAGWKHGDRDAPDVHVRQLYARELTRTFGDLTNTLVAYQEGERRAHGFSFASLLKDQERDEASDAEHEAELAKLAEHLSNLRRLQEEIAAKEAPKQIEAKPPSAEWWNDPG